MTIKWFDAVPISEITPRLFIGGYVHAARLGQDNSQGITAVLNVSTEPPYPQSPELLYMDVPFDDGHEIPRGQFIKALGWLRFVYENGHKILVHCAAGISRSVIITASFMHHQRLMEFDDALELIRERRSIANPAPAVQVSAKKMLGVFPYDGSFGAETVSEHEKILHETFIWMDAHRAARAHPNELCPMKIFLLTQSPEDNTPRHTIECTCPVLLEPKG